MSEALESGAMQTALLQCLADGACRTFVEMRGLANLDNKQVTKGTLKLLLRGYVERAEAGCFQLTAQGLAAVTSGEVIKGGRYKPDTARARKPLANTFRQRVWTAMRMSGTFTIGDLELAARRDEKGAANVIGYYLRKLAAAGYVVELPVRKAGVHLTSNGFKRFRLLKDTGPIAPVYQEKRKRIFDHNSQEATPCSSK